MKKFDDNFQIFEEQFLKVRDSRVSEYRNKVLKDVEEFFTKIHDVTNIIHEEKKQEVDEIFKKLKIDDLSDMEKYSELH